MAENIRLWEEQLSPREVDIIESDANCQEYMNKLRYPFYNDQSVDYSQVHLTLDPSLEINYAQRPEYEIEEIHSLNIIPPA